LHTRQHGISCFIKQGLHISSAFATNHTASSRIFVPIVLENVLKNYRPRIFWENEKNCTEKSPIDIVKVQRRSVEPLEEPVRR